MIFKAKWVEGLLLFSLVAMRQGRSVGAGVALFRPMLPVSFCQNTHWAKNWTLMEYRQNDLDKDTLAATRSISRSNQ